MTWQEAYGECVLYGGELVQIETLKEQNCLVNHGSGLGSHWYWTSGTTVHPLLLNLFFSLATDFDKNGVWQIGYDEHRMLEWLNPKWGCNNQGRDDFFMKGGDAIILIVNGNGENKYGAAWCDELSYNRHLFICEAQIEETSSPSQH